MTLIALTLWRPWDHSIIHGPKRVENRPRRPWFSAIGTDIALHAGLTYDDKGADFIRARGHELPRRDDSDLVAGHIVGVVRLVRATHIAALYRGCEAGRAAALRQLDLLSEPDPILDDPWAFGPYVWVLDHVRPLRTPVRCRGAQGLWRTPDDVEAAVRAQLEAEARHADGSAVASDRL